jgi:integrase/recombinase XerC
MSATAATAPVPALDHLVSEYLRVLANERAASAHTLRAYERELTSFASYIMERYGQEQSPARIEHRPQQRALWRRFAAGSSGWRARAA